MKSLFSDLSEANKIWYLALILALVFSVVMSFPTY